MSRQPRLAAWRMSFSWQCSRRALKAAWRSEEPGKLVGRTHGSPFCYFFLRQRRQLIFKIQPAAKLVSQGRNAGAGPAHRASSSAMSDMHELCTEDTAVLSPPARTVSYACSEHAEASAHHGEQPVHCQLPPPSGR